MEVRLLRAFPCIYWTVCSRSSMRQHVSFTEPASTTTLSPLLQELHWLSVHERFKYRLAVLVFRCRYDMALEYMARDLQWATDTDSRQRLRSSSSQQLIVPRSRLFTVADRTFNAAVAHIRNSLPPTVTSAATLNSFKKHLKTHLFHCSYPSLWLLPDLRLRLLTFLIIIIIMPCVCRQSIWENQYYYLFGFLFVVFIILVVSCSQISIVFTYFQLCGEVGLSFDNIN